MKGELLPLGVIPARANSTRFPLKVLTLIAGKPLIQHVWESASRCTSLGEVLVATDSEEVLRVVTAFGGKAVMTPVECPSGGDRVAFVARDRLSPIVVNFQGDEPLLPPEAVDRLVEALESDSRYDMATLAVKKSDAAELANPNVVKVVFGEAGHALYFSRQALASSEDGTFYKHIGIYAYRREVLLRLCELKPSPLERTERLEQLRALESGFRIKVIEIDTDTVAVDVPGDVARVEKFLSKA